MATEIKIERVSPPNDSTCALMDTEHPGIKRPVAVTIEVHLYGKHIFGICTECANAVAAKLTGGTK